MFYGNKSSCYMCDKTFKDNPELNLFEFSKDV